MRGLWLVNSRVGARHEVSVAELGNACLAKSKDVVLMSALARKITLTLATVLRV
jgi:hypothetical protein